MLKRIISAAIVAAALPITATAGMLEAGDYKILDYNEHRSVWTPGGGDGFVAGTKNWSFLEDAIFSYDPDGASPTAVLSATAEAVGHSNLFLDFHLEFDVSTSGNTPFCRSALRLGDGTKACDPMKMDFSDWTYFSMITGTATGVGALAGMEFKLTSNPMHNPQAGIGANAKDDHELGFSMWFTWERTGDEHAGGYLANEYGKGDINSDLEYIDPVPLPAAGWMLIAGLGGLAAAGRRKAA